MSYRIQYGPNRNQTKHNIGINKFYVIVAMIICLFAGAFLCKDRLAGWLIPGNDDVTKKAYAAFCQQLEIGEPFGVAFEVFCREILDDAR